MSDDRGFHTKFYVERRDHAAKHRDCDYFVLDITHDPDAKVAVLAYADAVAESRPVLSRDLKARYG